MGEVWRAFDSVTERTLAIKVLPSHLADDNLFQQRFRREAKSAAGLDEPHVVPIFDFGEIDGRLYVAMRLIQGQDLQDLLNEGPLQPAYAVRIIEQIAAALQAAHRIGLVHRDVKPSNILVTGDDFAYLIDFGIARAAGETSLTSSNITLGTWAYMAPERFRGIADARADTYALACVLYQSLTGKLPFPGKSLEQLATAHMFDPPPQPSLVQHGVPPAMDKVIAKGMAKDPDKRYQTARDLAQAAWAALTTGEQSQADTIMADTQEAPTPARTRPPWRRAAFAAAFVAIFLVASVGIAKSVMRSSQHDSGAANSTTAATTSAQPEITFESMRDFVVNYYADLPANPRDAWAKLDTHCQNQTGQRDFSDFWASIQSVTVVSVSPRDATSVVAQLKYVRTNGTSDSENRWLRVTLVNGAMLIDESGRVGSASGSPTAPPQPLYSPKAIDQVLLTADQLTKALGVTVTSNPAGGGGGGALAIKSSSYGMGDHSGQVKPPSCAGVAFTGEHDVYATADPAAIKIQIFGEQYGGSGNNAATYYLEQTAVVVSSTEQAQKLLKSAQSQWDTCSSSQVDVTLGFENGRSFKLGDVKHEGDLITIRMASWDGLTGLHACQQALGVRANVIVEARTCEDPSVPNFNWQDPLNPAWASPTAAPVANAMLDKVKV